MAKKIKVEINIDQGLKKWNEKNPEKRQMTRQDVYESQGITKTTIQNWKNGKVPKAFETLFSFLDETGLKLKDIVSATNENGKSIL